MYTLSHVLSLIGYKDQEEQIAYTKLLAYRACFNHPKYYLLSEKNKQHPGFNHRAGLALQDLSIWEKLNLFEHYPNHEGKLISDKDAYALLNIQFISMEEGFTWLNHIADIYFLRKEFEGESVVEIKSSVNTDRWKDSMPINPDLKHCAEQLHLIDENPWPKDEAVKHVVVISSLEKIVKERIHFLHPYSGFLYYLASPRGLFNNESALAYILADWFGCPEKLATIQSVLERYSDDGAPFQWFRELSKLKKEILSALQIKEWFKAPQSYYYADKSLYDKAAQIAGREPLDCLGGPWPVAADMAWFYFKQQAARHHEQFGELTFVPVIALGKGHKITTMDELIYAWFKRYGRDIISQGESPIFILCNQAHALSCAMANLSQKTYYQRSMMQNNMQNKLIQFKDRKNGSIIADKIRIAGPGAKYLNETLLFDGIAKSMFPLRKVIKNLIYEYLYIDQESYPAILLKKMARFYQLNEYLSLSNSAVDLAIEFNKRNEIIPSSGLFNFSSNVLNKHKTPKTTHFMHLIRKCTLLNMQKFLDLSPLKYVTKPARILRSSDVANKMALQDIRTRIHNQFNSLPVDGSLKFLSDTADLYQVIFSEMKNYLIMIIKQCSDILGLDPLQFSFCYLGSNSKAQATPFSDLEFFILVNDNNENAFRIVKELTKLILLKVINLGDANSKVKCNKLLEC